MVQFWMGMVVSTMMAVPCVFACMHSAFIAFKALEMTIMNMHTYVHPTTSVLAMSASMQLYAYGRMMVAVVIIKVYMVATTSITFKRSKS